MLDRGDHLERLIEAHRPMVVRMAMCMWRGGIKLNVLARARLQFEVAGANTETIIALEAEVSDFKRVCRALKAVAHA
jgi:hypothetical protein